MPRVRQSILAATVLHADRSWYLADLARHIGVTPSSLQRDLAALTGAGVLLRQRDGNRTYYRADPACPFLSDLCGMLVKTVGIVDVLRDALTPRAQEICVAFVYGSVASGAETSRSDVDLMVVGPVGLADLAGALRQCERTMLRPVNAMTYTVSEFRTRIAENHPFLSQVMQSDRQFVVGDADDLERAAG